MANAFGIREFVFGHSRRRRSLGIVVGSLFQTGEHFGNVEVDALAVEEVADFLVAGLGEMIQSSDEVLTNADGTMRIGAEDDWDFAVGHHAEHFEAGIHLGVAFIEARGVQLHGDACCGNAIKHRGNGVFHDGEAPRVRVVVFDQIGMCKAVVETGLGGFGKVVKIGAAEVLDGAGLVLVEVLFGLPMDGTKDVVEVGPLVQFGDVFFAARVVLALNAEADVELAFEGVGSALHDGDVRVEFGLGHANGGPEAIGHGAVAGEDDPFESGFDCLLGVLFRLPPGMFAQWRVHVRVVKQSARLGRARGG